MYESKEQIFYYHAYALGLGGIIERHGQKLAIPSIGSAALSSAGGEACVKSGPFEWAPPCEPQGGFSLSIGEVSSRLWSKEDDDYWTSEAEVRVSNFNLCNRVCVGLMVNRMTSQHKKRRSPTYDPAKDHQPRITFSESQFFNVFVDGQRLDVTVNRALDQCARYDELRGLIANDVANGGEFCRHNLLTIGNDGPEYVQDLARKYISERYTRCSIINEIRRPEEARFEVYGYSIYIPDFGRIFFGELQAADGMKRLNMLRWNLGCADCGDGTSCATDMNGVPMP